MVGGLDGAQLISLTDPGAATMTRPRIFVSRDPGGLALGDEEVERDRYRRAPPLPRHRDPAHRLARPTGWNQ
jgi:hypothetical protein